MPRSRRQKKDLTQYIAPTISSLTAALVLLVVSKGCATSDSTHNAVNTLTQHDIPIINEHVAQTQKDVGTLSANVAKAQSDISDVKGSSVTKNDLESKNQGLQTQIRTLYENQNTLKDKINDLQVQAAKNGEK